MNETDIQFNDLVALKTGSDQSPRMVTAVCMRYQQPPLFELTCGTQTTWHRRWEFEPVAEKKTSVGFEVPPPASGSEDPTFRKP